MSHQAEPVHRTSLTSGAAPISYQILPLELWDCVFQGVDDDEDLLRLATSCKTFNELCIRTLLRRSEDCEHAFTCTQLYVKSHFLPALHLSFRTFPFRRLICNLGPGKLRRDLRIIQELIPLAYNLRDLNLLLPHDLFDVTVDGYAKGVVLDALCGPLSAIVLRVDGPVFVITNSTVFSCMPHDVASWKLDLFEFNSGWSIRGLVTRVQRVIGIPLDPRPQSIFQSRPQTRVTLHTGGSREVAALTALKSVTVQSIVGAPGPIPAFSIITFNHTIITSIRLGDSMAGLIPYLHGAHWSAFLPHVSLPELRTAVLVTDTIDPGALRAFLANHTDIREIVFEGFHHDSRAEPSVPVRIVVAPPLAHPGLTSVIVKSFGRGYLGQLLPALAASPNLNTLSLAFAHRLHAAELRGLAGDFEAFGAECTNDVALDLHLFASDRRTSSYLREGEVEEETHPWSLDARVLAAAHTLHPLRAMTIAFSTAQIGVETLGWIAALPALRSVHIMQFMGGHLDDDDKPGAAVDAERAAFDRLMDEARRVLVLEREPAARVQVEGTFSGPRGS